MIHQGTHTQHCRNNKLYYQKVKHIKAIVWSVTRCRQHGECLRICWALWALLCVHLCEREISLLNTMETTLHKLCKSLLYAFLSFLRLIAIYFSNSQFWHGNWQFWQLLNYKVSSYSCLEKKFNKARTSYIWEVWVDTQKSLESNVWQTPTTTYYLANTNLVVKHCGCSLLWECTQL